MKSRLQTLLGMLFWLGLGALLLFWFQEVNSKKVEKSSVTTENRAQRKQAAQDVIKAGPKTTEWQTPQGTLIELNIPRSTMGGTLVENKRCIVWRDAITKTASLSCDQKEIDLERLDPDPPEIPYKF
jgi:hypothetical protein